LLFAFNLQALRDLDFEVRQKLFLEKVLDVEFQDATITDKAVFYAGKEGRNFIFLSSRSFGGASEVTNTYLRVSEISQGLFKTNHF
jgi:hypothetical protein